MGTGGDPLEAEEALAVVEVAELTRCASSSNFEHQFSPLVKAFYCTIWKQLGLVPMSYQHAAEV